MHILVTGAAGFIGFHASLRFVRAGHTVCGVDNINDYYSPDLKRARLRELAPYPGFRFELLDLADNQELEALFARERFTHVLHLAAQAGVRYSLENPASYVRSNLVGFANILEGCRRHSVRHLVYASSSSVYGLNAAMPFSTSHTVDHPISLYAASKKSNELMAHVYSYLYALPCTGLRFFTVYGPWGRPDMALYIFTRAILGGEAIPVFNQGRLQRDFTYIDDIIDGVEALMEEAPISSPDWNPLAPDPASSVAPYQLFNIGNNHSVPLMDFIELLEEALGKKAQMNLLPMQPGDVAATYADIEPLRRAVGFSPKMPLREGIARFVAWYKSYHGLGAVSK